MLASLSPRPAQVSLGAAQGRGCRFEPLGSCRPGYDIGWRWKGRVAKHTVASPEKKSRSRMAPPLEPCPSPRQQESVAPFTRARGFRCSPGSLRFAPLVASAPRLRLRCGSPGRSAEYGSALRSGSPRPSSQVVPPSTLGFNARSAARSCLQSHHQARPLGLSSRSAMGRARGRWPLADLSGSFRLSFGNCGGEDAPFRGLPATPPPPDPTLLPPLLQSI